MKYSKFDKFGQMYTSIKARIQHYISGMPITFACRLHLLVAPNLDLLLSV